jgi:heptosyltransferase III
VTRAERADPCPKGRNGKVRRFMKALKLLEYGAKRLLALLLAAGLFRPGRQQRARGTRPRRVLLVRVDNRVGEALLMTPLLSALKQLSEPPVVEVLVHEKAVRVLSGHPGADRVIGLNRAGLWLGPLAPGIRPLRQNAYDVVVDCGSWTDPSVTSAIVARLCAPSAVVLGPAIFPTGLLHDVSVRPRGDTRSERLQRLHFLSPLKTPSEAELSFRSPAVSKPLAGLIQRLGRYAVVNPGGRLRERRVPPQLFAELCVQLKAADIQPLVTWGPSEEALAHEVARPSGAEVAPPTDLDGLAALMQSARLTVCNNTGPMHLSVAVGTPTLALFAHMELARWGHAYPPHRMVDLTSALLNERATSVATGALQQLLREIVRVPAAAVQRP